ncbi:zinc finger protein 2 [Trypanosoma theileri]|uniref:Zinc finger protein 2 n=1 Tax=Trypanosoma theileri TaxID=67003 RepID=A0A1X0NUY8_9TRYP|nr:zinc finger protein 2 [Trypanosoma theileri]ORC88303.1 zinc finger protein 2 [Trypanosoma theileri]
MSYPQRFDRGAPAAQYGALHLPIGWQAAYSPEGEVYYIDHNTRTTHWQIPPEVLQRTNQAPGYRVGRVRRGIDQTKLKTKMCMNIQNGGKCTWGDSCAFAHSSDELAVLPHGTGNQRGGDGNPYRMKTTANGTNSNNTNSNGVNDINNNNNTTDGSGSGAHGSGPTNYMEIQQAQQTMMPAQTPAAPAQQQQPQE